MRQTARWGSPSECGRMLYATLLLLLCVSSAPLGSYTISSSNRLTTQSTTTETVKFYAPKLMASGKAKFTFNTQTGEFDCDDAEKAVSNCDLMI